MRKRVLTMAIVMLLGTTAWGVQCASSTSDDKVALQAMTVAQLEKAGDECRAVKDYPQAILYLQEWARRDGKNAIPYNKLGLAELKANRLEAARSDFARAAKLNRKYPEPLNNLGAVDYLEKNYASAARYFKKAVALDETRTTFHVNLGAAWFAQNEMERAIAEYRRALELDPDALVKNSNAGVMAQISSAEERAKQDYMLAKVYAKLGDLESCLRCLEKAKENGARDLNKVYKEEEFSKLWSDPRLAKIVPLPVQK